MQRSQQLPSGKAHARDEEPGHGALIASSPVYLLVLLTLCYGFSVVDKQLLIIVQESVKRDFSLSDTQLGLLTGFAFSALYAIAAVPLGRIADRSGLRRMIAVTTVIWSSLTTLAGFVNSVAQLFTVRMGVAAGEAGCSPAATAMITGAFPEHRRSTALSFFWMVGGGFGVLTGFLVGGILNDLYGWRHAFFFLGLPGVVLALLVHFTLREPKPATTSEAPGRYSMSDCARMLVSHPVLRLLLLGGTLSHFAAMGALNWSVSLFSRSFGMPTSSAGMFLALSYGIGGTVAALLIGRLADRLGQRDPRWQTRLLCITMVAMGLAMIGAYTASSLWIAMAFLAVPLMLASVFVGIVFSLANTMCPAGMRATISSVFISTFNFGGLGIGNLVVGMLSDALAPGWAQHSLRGALLIAMPAAAFLAAAIYFVSSVVAGRQAGAE